MIQRDATDQGFATGLSMALAYSIAVLMQDGIESATNQFVDEDNASPVVSQYSGLIASVAAVTIGLAAQVVFAQKEREPIERSVGRTAGYWLSVAGASGATLRTISLALQKDNENRSTKQQIESSLFIFPLGVLIALLFDLIKYRRVVSVKDNPIVSSPAKALVAGLGLIVALTTVSKTESFIAQNVQKVVDNHAKPLSKGWLPIGHVASSAMLAGGMYYGMSKLYHKIESSQDTVDLSLKTPKPAGTQVVRVCSGGRSPLRFAGTKFREANAL